MNSGAEIRPRLTARADRVLRRIMIVYGTRPEAVKVAPLIKALECHPKIAPIAAVTGQHREMLDQVNSVFGIEPKHDLDLMIHGATVADITARALTATSALIEHERPDAVLVQGDTSTAFSTGLAAFYHRVPLIHLEAGLRAGDMSAPFPEEANRRLLAPLATLHLAPTPTSRKNLLKEGIAPASIATTGNTVIDALRASISKPPRFGDAHVRSLVASGHTFVLVTTHRRESWGHPMRSAMAGISAALEQFPNVRLLLPMHRNPTVRLLLEEHFRDSSQVLLTEPLAYHEFCHVMAAAHVVVTDSGGIQEEAPSLGKPVLVMRDTTERPEAVAAGTVRLVGTDSETVRRSLATLLGSVEEYRRMASAVNPYGDGRAAERSVAALEQLFGLGERLPDFGG